ncbi:phosphatidylethanolamine-binding protein [Gigaspora rosea]|uniref:Phosphatidylethanolamine-binding protein n=1 Tax=Gigaspora rosea TaxID=44941 RepID=A0A397VE52_9GLOM|nr:phosphatidylethanolamine-binding protein [Gigaspora rosea]
MLLRPAKRAIPAIARLIQFRTLPNFFINFRTLKIDESTTKPLAEEVIQSNDLVTEKEIGVKKYKTIPLGINPAYDEAIKYILQDKANKYQQIKQIDEQINNFSKAELNDEIIKELEVLHKRKYLLQVQAEVNDPEVRWNFKNDIIDMSKPVYRHLKEKHWKSGPLPKLMERITQMYVVPDIFPDLEPTMCLEFKFDDEFVEPGRFQRPIRTINPPTIVMNSFHVETRLYTLIMVDPDMPDVENKSFQMQWHWLITNIPISATKIDISGGNEILKYVPPHPPKGTKYHRYTLGAFEQSNGKIEMSKMDLKMNVREFVSQHNLILRGATFFREVWDKDVSSIYKDQLGIHEPIYSKPPKIDHYLDETGKKRPSKFIETL